MLTHVPARIRWFVGGLVLLATACGPSLPSPATTAGPSSPPASPAASPRWTGPAATAQILEIEDLPLVEPDPDTLTAICDPYPNQLDPDAGESTLVCFDSIVLGLRALRTLTDEPVLRAYLIRPECPPVPCSAESLDKGTLALWTAGNAYAVLLDSRASVVAAPVPIGGNNWPVVAILTPPPVGREDVLPAPPAVATRTPLPYCGHGTAAAPEHVLACFRNSVLAGKPAEVIRDGLATEGGVVIEIVGFDGAGAITRYERADGRWVEQRGSLILGRGESVWDVEAWSAGVVLG